jgi:hypothetical protein
VLWNQSLSVHESGCSMNSRVIAKRRKGYAKTRMTRGVLRNAKSMDAETVHEADCTDNLTWNRRQHEEGDRGERTYRDGDEAGSVVEGPSMRTRTIGNTSCPDGTSENGA